METLEEIWAGDLFDRQQEAEDVMGYLQSVAGRPSIREDAHAHVLAVDSGYGQGKTFFLRRLARHMQHHSHAVAFVDAWVDDLEDEPMVALAATLEEALDPYIQHYPSVKEKFGEFCAKAGRVAKIVGFGALKRGAGLLISQSAAEALGDELTNGSDATKDIRKDALKSAGTGTVDDAIRGFAASSASLMTERIARFRDGQQAIRDMKVALAAVVEALIEAGMKLPVTIIVDELDRCRPTYAIKVLEEIKHLFDVPGVAFVLGLHGEQLAHSVGAAYGNGFDGTAYLRRFFNRRYTLQDAKILPLINKLITELAIDTNSLVTPPVSLNHRRPSEQLAPGQMIALVLEAYGVKPRDVFQIIEMIQTSVALTKGSALHLPYLTALIVSHVHGATTDLPKINSRTDWIFKVPSGDYGRAIEDYSLEQLMEQLHIAAMMPEAELLKLFNADNAAYPIKVVAETAFGNASKHGYEKPTNYRKLLAKVERFATATDPQTPA